MKRLPPQITEKINRREQENTLRTLKNNHFTVDFYSNDYLGFAFSQAIKSTAKKILSTYDFQSGATGSRLLSGNHPLFERVETEIRQFHQSESALLFNSGYDANVGFFASVPVRGDVVLFDSHIHASIRDGLSLSLAKSYKFKHNDIADLEQLLRKFATLSGSVFVVTESVFSMDGDSPDLLKIQEIVDKYGAFLMVDEAHALGVFGEKGEGLVQALGLGERVFARIVTFGKAMGCHGAALLSSNEVKTYTVNFARSFIYTTAMSLQSVAQIASAYRYVSETESREKLHRNISYFKAHKPTRFLWRTSDSAIQALMLSGNDVVQKTAKALQGKGFGVMPILSPTVAKGEERIRICLHSFNTATQIDDFFKAVEEIVSLS